MVADVDQWIRELAPGVVGDIARGDADNVVFHARRVLSQVWAAGFEAGQVAASRDRLVVRAVEQELAKAKEEEVVGDV